MTLALTPRRVLIALAEGAHFLWRFRRASPAYVRWRLGTIYGSFDRETGRERTVRELLGDLARDWRQAFRFLLWSRDMTKRRLP